MSPTGECGGNHYWKATVNKIMRAGFYRPTIFFDTHNKVASCHKCNIFKGRRKLFPLPLKPIQVESTFQEWGLDFIGEINPSSSGKHKWILTANNYFTKWIKDIPMRQSTETVIMQFLEEHIMSRFGVPEKIIIDNAADFKSKKMIAFFFKYQI